MSALLAHLQRKSKKRLDFGCDSNYYQFRGNSLRISPSPFALPRNHARLAAIRLKVSIIIPLYNKAPYVRRALESISVQSFRDFEVIIVDDGSTDDGAAIVAGYPDKRFRLISQTNAGPGAARNAGLKQARCELIAFLDADDEWLPNYLQESVSLLENLGSEVASVTCGYIEHPAGVSMESRWRKRGLADGVHRIQPDTDPALVVSMLAYMSPCSTLTRAEVVRKWGGFFDREKCVFGEDAFLWLKVLLNEQVVFNLKPLVQFHREAAGLSYNLSGSRPVEPFLKDPREIEAACPPALRDLLAQVIAIRAAKTACVLGYWGRWREARDLVKRYTAPKNWRLPYHVPAVVCSTPVGSALGASWRAITQSRTDEPARNGNSTGKLTPDFQIQTPRAKIRILALVEALNVNAIAKNMFEFHRAATELAQQSTGLPAIELSLVTFDRDNNTAAFVAAARELKIEIDLIPERGRFDRSVIRSLRGIVARRAPDVIVSHQVKSHFLINISRLWKKYPWIAFNHGYTSTDRKDLIYNRLDRWSLPKADRVVTVCEAFAGSLGSMGMPRDRIYVQHNSIRRASAVGVSEIQLLKEALGLAEGERIILCVGRLSKEKAQIDLLHAFATFTDLHSEIKARLVIVGDGPERKALAAATASLGIEDRVVFAGQVNKVGVYYAAADLLVNPSHSEGSPYVLLEAMGAGLPIVATEVGGVPEILEHQQTAVLIPAGEPQAMAEAIAQILSDKSFAAKLADNAGKLVSTRFSPETYVRSLVDLYRQAISRRTV